MALADFLAARRTRLGLQHEQPAKLPAKASGSMSLDPSAAGTTLTYRIDLAVDLPFVAGLVERAVATQIRRSLRAEAAVYAEPPS